MNIKPGTKFRVPTEKEVQQAGWTLKRDWLWMHPGLKDGLDRQFLREHGNQILTTTHRETPNDKAHWKVVENNWWILEDHIFIFLTIDFSQLKTLTNPGKCECGGDTCKTTHAHWCPKWSDK